MQTISPESLLASSERPQGLQQNQAEVEEFLRAPRATLLIVLTYSENGFTHMQFVAPRPNPDEAFDPDLHYNSLTQTLVGKCEVASLSVGNAARSTYILRVELDTTLAESDPNIGGWSTIAAKLHELHEATPHPTMHRISSKPFAEITPAEFTAPELIVTYKPE